MHRHLLLWKSFAKWLYIIKMSDAHSRSVPIYSSHFWWTWWTHGRHVHLYRHNRGCLRMSTLSTEIGYMAITLFHISRNLVDMEDKRTILRWTCGQSLGKLMVAGLSTLSAGI